jgi:peptidyl-prolyl cis-trans isomerase A (cyclophilin A)
MNKIFSFVFIVGALCACNHEFNKEPHIVIETGYGDIEVELYPEKAPKTVAAFLSNIDSGLYNKSSFYRVLKNDNVPEEYNTGLIQGGIFKTNMIKHSQLKGIEHESPRQTGLSHVSGTISMARLKPGTATSEFFICIGDQKQFDSSNIGSYDGQGYAAFGKVVEGMKVVMKIQNKKSSGDNFIDAIEITSIKKL